MCIIIHKPAGIKLDEDVYRECFCRNKDGAGMAFVDKGKVVVDKGYFSFKRLYAAIKKLEEGEMIIHFRIATHGAVGIDNCHPFGFEPKRYPNYSFAMAHNGQLRWRSNEKKSDTSHFADDLLFKQWQRDPYFAFEDDGVGSILLENFLGANNKMVLMRHNSAKNETEVKILNEEAGVKDMGCWFSNRSYKVITCVNGCHHGAWSEWEDGEPFPTASAAGQPNKKSNRIVDRYGYKQNKVTGRWEPRNVWEPREMKEQRERDDAEQKAGEKKEEAGTPKLPFPKPPEPSPAITVHDFSKKHPVTPIQTSIPLLQLSNKDSKEITVPRDPGVVAATKIFDTSEIDLTHLNKMDRDRLRNIAASWARACGFERKSMGIWQMIRGVREDFRNAVNGGEPVSDENIDRWLLIELKGDAAAAFDAMKEMNEELKISTN